jgi:type IV fimbrial biogenesis protein FimT
LRICDSFHKLRHTDYTKMLLNTSLPIKAGRNRLMKQDGCQDVQTRGTRHSGFTLIELLVTVALASILLGLGIPSFYETIKNNRLTGYANELLSALSLARSQAVKTGKRVTVRKVDNNSFTNLSPTAEWENGWDVFIDETGDGIYNGADSLIKTYSALKSNYTLRGGNPFTSRITYLPTGGLSGLTGRFVVCDDSDGNSFPEANTSRLIMVYNTGRAKNMPDTDSPPNGIPDDGTGNDNLNCDP